MALQDSYYYNTTNSGTADYLSKSFAGQLMRTAPNGMCPLFGLTSMLPAGTCTAVEHGYFTKAMVFPSVQLNGAIASGVTTTFTVDSTDNIIAGQLLRANTTGEVVRVTSVDSSTQLTVKRGVGQVSAAAIADDVKLYSIGNAFEQGSNAPASRLMNPTRVINHTQIFRNTWALPGTVTAIAPIVGNSLVAESRQDCASFHGADIETALIFGQKSGQTVNSQYLTTMSGIVEHVRSLAPVGNTSTASSTTNYTQLQTMVNGVFDTQTNGRNGNRRIMLCGGSARTVINDIGRLSGDYTIVEGQTSFGLQFQSFRTSRGEFKLIEHPMLNSNDDWKKMALVVDMDSVRVPHLRKTSNFEYGMDGRYVANGQDAVGGTLTTELTMEVINPSAFAVIYGLTAGAA
jgi:hypothetical protein